MLESVHYNLVEKIKQNFGDHIMHQANLKEPTRLGPDYDPVSSSRLPDSHL